MESVTTLGPNRACSSQQDCGGLCHQDLHGDSGWSTRQHPQLWTPPPREAWLKQRLIINHHHHSSSFTITHHQSSDLDSSTTWGVTETKSWHKFSQIFHTQDVFVSPQRGIFRKRLQIKDVKDGSAEEVVVKSKQNVRLTDDVPTTNIDEADILAMFEVFSKICLNPLSMYLIMYLVKRLFVSWVAGRTLMR